MSVDDSRPKRSLADDPNFLASLSDLDRGLEGDEDEAAVETPPTVRPARARNPPPPRQAAPAAHNPVLPPPPSAVQARVPVPQRAQVPQRAAAPAPRTPAVPQRPAAAPRPPAPRPSPIAPFPTTSTPSTVGAAPGRRALIDLFPPAPRERERPPGPLLGEAIGPHLPRTRPVAVAAPPPQDAFTYETFYGLNEKPFSLSCDPKFLYHSTSHDRAAQELLDAIHRHDGVVVVTGEVGIGKTMLCRIVIEQLDRRTLTSFVSDPFASIEDLLKTLLVDFGVSSREDLARGQLMKATRQELTDALRSFLASLAALQASAVVIIDDAPSLPLEALQHIQALADSEGASRTLQVVLVGEPSLLHTLRRAELKPLDHHVTLRCALGPLQVDEIAGYVMHRIAIAGTSPRVEFDDGAFTRVFELSRGVPRLVNLICDHALTLGHDLSASVIDDELVEAAAEQIEVVQADVERRGTVRTLATMLLLGLLMFAGAGAAASVFHDRLEHAIVQWQAIPQAPGGPVLHLPVPLVPIPPPADDPSTSSGSA